MNIFLLVPHYIVWHYTQAISNLFAIWGNLIWFLYNFFSIKLLFQTLLSPFERLTEESKGGLDIESFFSALIVNTLMRIVGFFVRSIVIIIGLLSILLLFLGGLFLFIIWLFIPFLILLFFVLGVLSLTGYNAPEYINSFFISNLNELL